MVFDGANFVDIAQINVSLQICTPQEIDNMLVTQLNSSKI